MQKRFLLAALLIIALPLHGFAQAVPAIDVGADGFASVFGGAHGLLVRATLPKSERTAVEPFITFHRDQWSTRGWYGIQWRRDVSRDGGTCGFVTFGISGPYVDGLPLPPVIPVGGVGVRQEIGHGLAVRADAQAVVALLIPVGVRVSAVLSVAVGRGH